MRFQHFARTGAMTPTTRVTARVHARPQRPKNSASFPLLSLLVLLPCIKNFVQEPAAASVLQDAFTVAPRGSRIVDAVGNGRRPLLVRGLLTDGRVKATRSTTTMAVLEAAAASEAAAAAAPVIGAVVAVAAAASALQLSNVFSQDGGKDSSSMLGGGDDFFGERRWQGRTLGIFVAWLCFIGYAFLLAPGQEPAAKATDLELIKSILSTPFDGTVSPLFVCLFNSLGIWPAIYAATLLPGGANQSPLPAWPFVGSSFVVGAVGLSPYLALREYRGTQGSAKAGDLDWFTRNFLESRLTGAALLAGAVYLALYALGNGTIGAIEPGAAWAGFLPVFMGSLTPHVSTVDFLVLWMFYSPVLLEDGRRRGIFNGSPSTWSSSDTALFVACAGLPVFGGCIWLLLRPSLRD